MDLRVIISHVPAFAYFDWLDYEYVISTFEFHVSLHRLLLLPPLLCHSTVLLLPAFQ